MTQPDRTDDAALEAFALQLADAAATVTLPAFRTPLGVEDKRGRSDFDPVTRADRDAERAMRDMIEARFPDHGIFGEEHGEKSGAGRYSWILDPIDGTRSFILGLPLWGTLIGLRADGVPTLGVMDQPFTRERFVGRPGSSVLLRDGARTALRTSATTELAEANLVATSPIMFAGADAATFERLSGACRMTRFGGDCYLYCMLASGLVDLVVEAGLQPYDIVALVPIIENAGGVISTWDGGAAAQGGRIVAAANAELHQKALEVLRAGC